MMAASATDGSQPAASRPDENVEQGRIVRGLLCLAAAVSCSEGGEPPARPPDGITAGPAGAESRVRARLILTRATDYEDASGYRRVSGRVTNPSSNPLAGVRVVVTWYTDWEDLVTTREARLEPLPGGATVSFDVAGPAIPFASKFSVVFTDAEGAVIPTEIPGELP